MNTTRNHRILASILILSTFLALPLAAMADSEAPPRDYVKETPNGKYVFVMLAPELWSRFGSNSTIRQKYTQSGLYRNDGSTTPLWTVNWYSFAVFPGSDGVHLVQMGPWASDIEQLAVAFHKNGALLKAYRIKDLVRDESKLNYTVSHFFWRTSLDYDDKKGLLFLKTTDGTNYRFSVKTGEIESPRQAMTPSGAASEETASDKAPEKVILREPVRVTARLTKAEAPTKEVGGHYEFDVTFKRTALKNSKSSDEPWYRLEELLLATTILATYCKQDAEAATLVKLAESRLKPDRFALFRNLVSLVVPAEYPITREEG
jgi:hypothetical protein